MFKMRVLITWNIQRKQWDMLNAKTGHFIQEFFPCRNFHNAFKGASRTHSTAYNVSIERCEGD